jgi:hypothetical protein
MVRLLLGRMGKSLVRNAICVGLALALAVLAFAANPAKETAKAPAGPELLLEGGRKLSFERSFSLER